MLLAASAHAQVLDELSVFAEDADAVVRVSFATRIQYLRYTVVGDGLVEVYFQIVGPEVSPVTETRRVAGAGLLPGAEVIYPLQPRTQPQQMTVRLTRPAARLRVRPTGNRTIDLIIAGGAKPAAQAPARFAVRLESFASLDDMSRARPVPGEFASYEVMVSPVQRDGRTQYDLLLGFFPDTDAAERARARLLPRFPNAKVVDLRTPRLEAAPVAPGAPPIGLPPVPAAARPAPAPAAAPPASAAEVEARAAELIGGAYTALEAGDSSLATDRLNQLLLLPPNSQSQLAQELAGVARERSGETAKARAEYELYLKLYPESEGAARVRQRLAALAAPPAPGVVRRERPQVRALTGSISQYYYGGRTKVETAFNTPTTVDRSSFSAVDQSSLVTNIDLTLRNRSDAADTRAVLRNTNSASFIDTQRSYNRLTAAYFEYRGLQNPVSARVGRQTGLSGGLPSRFDGAIAGYGIGQKWRLNASLGVPVEYPAIDTDRQFWAANLEFENLGDSWSGNFFYVDQKADGLLDRRAVGAELRYFDPRKSLFSLVDYDTSYKEWNIAMVQGTWQPRERTTINLLFDRRKAPILATTNAILGQPTTSIATLLQSYTEEQLRQQAHHVTATTTQALIGFNTAVASKWQAGADARMTYVGPLPSVVINGIVVPAQPDTGNIYSYDLQAIGTNLYSSRDTSVFSFTYVTGPIQEGYLLAYNNLSVLAERWTVEPSIRYYSQTDVNDVKLERWQPGLRLSYRLRESFAIESEFFLEKTRTVGPASQDDTTRGFFYIGYRWNL